MRKVSLGVMAAAATAFLSPVPGAWAHGPELGEKLSNLAALSEEANLVFKGQVADIKYKQAKIKGGEGTLPFTVVTYSIGEVIRGKSPGNTFTMRFPGGPDGRGGFVDVSGVPKFEPGDEDILFVKENGEKGCPLVECEWGRFRIHEKAVFNTHGSPVKALGKSRALARGFPPDAFRKFRYPAPAFDELMKNPEVKKLFEAKKLKLDEARAQYEKEAPKAIEIRTVFPKIAPQGGPDVLGKEEAAAAQQSAAGALSDAETAKLALSSRAELAQLKLSELKLAEPELAKGTDPKLAELAFRDPELKLAAKPVAIDRFLSEVKATAAKVKRQPTELRSADAKEEIVIEFTGAKAPIAEPAAGEGTAAAADDAEVKALRAQGFDPVLKKKPAQK